MYIRVIPCRTCRKTYRHKSFNSCCWLASGFQIVTPESEIDHHSKCNVLEAALQVFSKSMLGWRIQKLFFHLLQVRVRQYLKYGYFNQYKRLYVRIVDKSSIRKNLQITSSKKKSVSYTNVDVLNQMLNQFFQSCYSLSLAYTASALAGYRIANPNAWNWIRHFYFEHRFTDYAYCWR